MEFLDAYNVIQNQIAQNNSWSAEQAQKQMDFQERLSNTAHQREVADLKAAGLNPVLSAHTNGASTPSGAIAQADQGSTNAVAGLLTDMIQAQTAIGVAQAKALGGAYGRGNGYSANGNYNFGNQDQALGNIIQDIIKGLTGKEPKQIAIDTGAGIKNAFGAAHDVLKKNGKTLIDTVNDWKLRYDVLEAAAKANPTTAKGWDWLYDKAEQQAEEINKNAQSPGQNPELDMGASWQLGFPVYRGKKEYWIDAQGRQYDTKRAGAVHVPAAK